MDSTKLQFFDPETGKNLAAAQLGERAHEALE